MKKQWDPQTKNTGSKQSKMNLYHSRRTMSGKSLLSLKIENLLDVAGSFELKQMHKATWYVIKLDLLQKDSPKFKALTMMNFTLQLLDMKYYEYSLP